MLDWIIAAHVNPNSEQQNSAHAPPSQNTNNPLPLLSPSTAT